MPKAEEKLDILLSNSDAERNLREKNFATDSIDPKMENTILITKYNSID